MNSTSPLWIAQAGLQEVISIILQDLVEYWQSPECKENNGADTNVVTDVTVWPTPEQKMKAKRDVLWHAWGIGPPK